MARATDEDLMAQVHAGDMRKLAILFERYHRALYRFFRRMNADPYLSEDLVQEVFFRILRYRRTFEKTRQFLPWMYQIARNTRADYAHRPRELRLVTEHAEDEQAVFEPASPSPDAEEVLERKQELRFLQEALDRLPLEKRELLILSRFQNLSHQEIARILDCEAGTVKVRIFRALKALGEIYFELSGEKAS